MPSRRFLSILGAVLLLGSLGLMPPAARAETLNSAPASSPSVRWQQFRSQSGRFVVSIPGTPKEEVDRAQKPGEFDSYSFMVDQGNSAYFVSYYDLPGQLAADKTQSFLNGVRDGAIKDGKAQILTDQDIRLGRYPGKSIKYMDQEGITYYCRMYVVNQRLYLTLVAIAKGQDSYFSGDAQRFLNSFRLL